VRHHDALLVEAGLDAGADVSLDAPVLAHGALCRHADQHGVGIEGEYAHDVRGGGEALDLLPRLLHLLGDDRHQPLLVLLIGAADVHDGPLVVPAHVGDGADVAVGDGVDIAVVVADDGGAHGDGLHLALEPVDIHDVAHGDAALAPDEQAGDHVLHQGLGPEGDGHAADAGQREDAGDVDAEHAQHHGDDDEVHQVVEHAGDQRPQGVHLMGALEQPLPPRLDEGADHAVPQADDYRPDEHRRRGHQHPRRQRGQPGEERARGGARRLDDAADLLHHLAHGLSSFRQKESRHALTSIPWTAAPAAAPASTPPASARTPAAAARPTAGRRTSPASWR